jgi:hypothetical protein
LELCHLHESWARTIPSAFGLPFPEDPVSLQMFLALTVHHVMTGKFDSKQCALLLELSRLLTKNVEAVAWERAETRE